MEVSPDFVSSSYRAEKAWPDLRKVANRSGMSGRGSMSPAEDFPFASSTIREESRAAWPPWASKCERAAMFPLPAIISPKHRKGSSTRRIPDSLQSHAYFLRPLHRLPIEHRRQAIAENIEPFLRLMADFGSGWTVFYNGPNDAALPPRTTFIFRQPIGTNARSRKKSAKRRGSPG